MKRVLSIWLPHWPIQRLVVADPTLKNGPLILYATAHQALRVVACSAAARRCGVRPMMTLAEARSLTRHGLPADGQGAMRRPESSPPAAQANRGASSIVLRPYDLEQDQRQLMQLAGKCERFSPLVGLDPDMPPAGLLLEIQGVTHLFGGERPLATEVVQWFAQQGYHARVAIAETVGGAWALARLATSGRSLQEQVHIIPDGQIRQAVDPLPVTALRLPEKTIDLLHQLGIQQIGQLLALPRAALPARFGEQVLVRIDQLLGNRTELIEPCRPPSVFQACWQWEHPSSATDRIGHAMQHVCHHLAHLLLEQGKGALQLIVQLYCQVVATDRPIDQQGSSSTQSVEMQLALASPTANGDRFWELIALPLERLRLPGLVQRGVLRAGWTTPLECGQQTLWPIAGGDALAPRRRLLERLSARLGSQAVVAARLRAGPLPQQMYVTIPLMGLADNRRRLRVSNSPRHRLPLPGQYPLQLLRTPLPLAATGQLASQRVGEQSVPGGFEFSGRMEKVRHQRGPQRIETSWWDGPCERRDYYQVCCESGNRFWLFYQRTERRWYLHGIFR